jgi:DNA-binding NtrC family response regulator
MILRILVACRRRRQCKRLLSLLHGADVAVDTLTVRTLRDEALAAATFDMLVIDGGLLGRRAAPRLRQWTEDRRVPASVVVVEKEDAAERAALLAAGCDAVLFDGLEDDELRGVFDTLIRRSRSRTQLALIDARSGEHAQLSDFVTESPAMGALVEVARRMVRSDTSLLILGETGVGKEWLARAIHAEGPRATGPFIPVNCGALAESLLESELFGHERGSFTGAVRERRGAFEIAHNGTIFLDEIGEMPLHLQVKLLRVLQDHTIQRVGGEKPIHLDVRIMAASNRDLQEEVRARRFRQDLYYRLGVVTLTVPPLRERREDIQSLVEGYIEHFRTRMNHAVEGITPAAMEALLLYEWPGNVREVVNVIERATILCDHGRIDTVHLPENVAGASAASPPTNGNGIAGEGRFLALPEEWSEMTLNALRAQVTKALERKYVTAGLRRNQGRVGATATQAGLTMRAMYDKMKRHGIRKEDFRPPRKPGNQRPTRISDSHTGGASRKAEA